MKFKPIELSKAFDLWYSILIDKKFMKKSASKVYYMLVALNKSILISFEIISFLSR